MTFEQARDYLLEKATAQSLEAEVLAQESREFSVRARQGVLDEITQATQGGVGLRVVVDGRVGYAYTEERTPEALDWILAEARDNALLQAASGASLPQGQNLGRHDLLGEGLSASVEQKREAALRLDAGLGSDPRVRQVQMASYQENELQVTLGSTRGLSGSSRSGYGMLMGYMVLQQGQSIKQAMDMAVSREFHALDPGRTSLEMVQKAARMLGAQPLKTGRYRAYFEARPMAQLLGMMGNFLLSGKMVLEGKSLWAHKLGQPVASSLLTLVDDPTLPQGLASRPFDVEGTPAQRTVLIENGILKTFAHNSETAQALQMANTGHAARSYKGPLGVGTTNLFVEPGLGIQLSQGVMISELMGLHAGVNPVSGDFSVQGLGLWVDEGQTQHAVENFAVSGNFFQLLEQITALGDTLEWQPLYTSVVGTPMVEVAQLSFAGA